MRAVINRHLEGLLFNGLLLIPLLNVNPIIAAFVCLMKTWAQDRIKASIPINEPVQGMVGRLSFWWCAPLSPFQDLASLCQLIHAKNKLRESCIRRPARSRRGQTAVPFPNLSSAPCTEATLCLQLPPHWSDVSPLVAHVLEMRLGLGASSS